MILSHWKELVQTYVQPEWVSNYTLDFNVDGGLQGFLFGVLRQLLYERTLGSSWQTSCSESKCGGIFLYGLSFFSFCGELPLKHSGCVAYPRHSGSGELLARWRAGSNCPPIN